MGWLGARSGGAGWRRHAAGWCPTRCRGGAAAPARERARPGHHRTATGDGRRGAPATTRQTGAPHPPGHAGREAPWPSRRPGSRARARGRAPPWARRCHAWAGSAGPARWHRPDTGSGASPGSRGGRADTTQALGRRSSPRVPCADGRVWCARRRRWRRMSSGAHGGPPTRQPPRRSASRCCGCAVLCPAASGRASATTPWARAPAWSPARWRGGPGARSAHGPTRAGRATPPQRAGAGDVLAHGATRAQRRRQASPGRLGEGLAAGAGGARGGVAHKGGDLASVHVGTHPADQRAPRGLPRATLLGDSGQAPPFDAAGTQRFVLAVRGRNRCKQATAAARVLHEPDLRKGDRFSPRCREPQGRKCPEAPGAPGRPNDCRRGG